jgi:hypothetical protein
MEKITSNELQDALNDDGYLMIAVREPIRVSIRTYYFKRYGSHPDEETVEQLLDRVVANYSVENE